MTATAMAAKVVKDTRDDCGQSVDLGFLLTMTGCDLDGCGQSVVLGFLLTRTDCGLS